MMRYKMMPALVFAGVLNTAAVADQWICPVISGSAETEAGNVGTIQNMAQPAIGRTVGGGINLHAGVIPCYVADVSGAGLLGDMNCDGVVTVSDIGPFVLALTNPAQYAMDFPDCNINNADMNQDSAVTVSDIGLFVAALIGG